ncbi:class I SAM-dependent methyltransferase [Ottowia sp. VDI28]|uniref:class I SAM-dependent methyltransferase n=1 Tax=Ottowia sp. VDI28 TaxID=3133968 RepID=UPI003C2C31C0
MSRIYSTSDAIDKPSIDKKSVAEFFEKRAQKITSLGPIQAVIYQDKNPDLAAMRDAAEKTKLLPLLRLDGTQRVLDVGCGTGRWAGELLQASRWYHGIDASEGLIAFARKQFSSALNGRFTTASVDAFSLRSLGETQLFDRVLCAGVLIYLNDDEIVPALRCIASVVSNGGLILLREPLGVERRLTISEHYSEDMEQIYNAIYRTDEELNSLISEAMPEGDFRIVDFGDVYDASTLNNRSDTKQKWFLLERI